ncbi:DUF7601 domain-containing protein [Peptostreptococcus russellii]|uniref:DUF7601 domain-containing protein n=1 Tax=Peptostreptococcus russellii TaxID=215200 RepID=UPI0026ED4D2D|nr:FctA domain-containing protein [Peptostreptococcus russellii]
MKNKRKTKLGALFLALAMTATSFLGTAKTFAEVNDNVFSGNDILSQIKLVKNFYYDNGLTLPTDQFTFDITKKYESDGSGVNHDEPTANMPELELTQANISFTEQAPGTVVNNTRDTKGDNKATKELAFKVKGTGTFPHAGEYRYLIKENVPDAKTDGITYSNKKYLLKLYVTDDGTDKVIKKATILDVTDKENDATNAVLNTGTKVTAMTFDNEYHKNNGNLKVKKILANTADNKEQNIQNRDRLFNFTIKMYRKNTRGAKTITGTIKKDNTEIVGSTEQPKTVNLVFEDGNAEGQATFKLKHEEYIEFSDIPVGTKYTVVENDFGNYNPYAKILENGVNVLKNDRNETNADAEIEGADPASKLTRTDKKFLIGENENLAQFTNKFNFIVVTGIVMKNLPFILMSLLAMAGFAVFTITKRRRYNH